MWHILSYNVEVVRTSVFGPIGYWGADSLEVWSFGGSLLIYESFLKSVDDGNPKIWG